MTRAALCLLSLAACQPDEARLRDQLPAGAVVLSRLSGEARWFECQRVTYQLDAASAIERDGFEPLESLPSSSFLRCLGKTETAFWRAAATAGNALWRVDEDAGEWHLWFDTASHRLLVMHLAR